MEPADAASGPFEVALTTFKATLKKSEVENFRFATGDEFRTAIDQIQTRLHHKRRQLNLTKLRSFVEAMTQFGKVLDVFCQTSETIAFIWGPWKFLLQNIDSLFTAFDEILDTYDQLGQTLSLVLQATELFPEDEQMVKVVASIYDEILAFHREAFRYFQKSNAKRFIHAIFQTYQKTFEDLIQAIKRHQQILLGQSTFSEARRARVHDERMRLQILESDQSRVRRELVLWLKGANTQNDHDRMLRIQDEFPSTGVWLLSKPEFKGWFERYTSQPPMLWLNGVPGAGKTVLSSVVIESCKVLDHKPHVLYFYCKGGDADRDNLSAIGRSLLLQLLKEDSDVMHWVYQEYNDSTEVTLDTLSQITRLLETAMKNCASIYLILDGIDECEREQRKSMVRWFRDLIQGLSLENQGQIRCLFVSQDDGYARKDFAGLITLKISPKDNRDDIQRFLTKRLIRIQDKFCLDDRKRDSVLELTLRSCDGMFLLANLIVENLMEQLTVEDLENELKPHTFPKSMNDAYERYMTRILSERTGTNIRKYCLLLFGWLVSAKRPFTWQEIQAAKSINLDSQRVDLSNRQLLENAKNLCGSLVEERDDGIVDLVHPTAKRFLIERKHVDAVSEEFGMFLICINYLNFPAFQLSTANIKGLLMSGHYTFMEYSALHWLRHFESAMSQVYESPRTHDVTHVAESLGVFLDIHWANPTATLPVPKGTKEKMRMFRDYPWYEKLLQAITSTRKQLSFFGEVKPAMTALDIFDTLRSVRQVIEASTLGDDQETQNGIRAMFGLNIFKCPRPSCHFFSNGFESAQLRDVHVAKHFRSIPCPFEGCPHLKIGFSNDKDLQKHLEQTHPMGFNLVDFPTDAELLNHEEQEQVNGALANPFEFGEAEEPESEHSRKRRKTTEYICPVCSKVFSKNYNLKSHMITHSPDKPFNCEHCDLQFARPSDLKRHQTSHVEGIYRCHGIATDGTSWGCNEVFKRADGLKDHWRSLKSCRPVSASTPTDLPFRSVGSDQPENRLTES